jgi:hypothetical protein
MAKRNYTTEQIIIKLREIEVLCVFLAKRNSPVLQKPFLSGGWGIKDVFKLINSGLNITCTVLKSNNYKLGFSVKSRKPS